MDINAVLDMDESVKKYVVINILVLFLIAMYFFKKPSKRRNFLKFSKNEASEPATDVSSESKESRELTAKKSQVAKPQKDWAQVLKNIPEPAARDLNVFFNHNGHSWEAYEVLGLPAGSSLKQVKESYQYNLKKVDEKSQSFIEIAYQSILVSLKK